MNQNLQPNALSLLSFQSHRRGHPTETQATEMTVLQEKSSGLIFHLPSHNAALVIGSIWKGYYPIFL